MSTQEIEEVGEKVGTVWDFVFLGAKIEHLGSCIGEFGRAAMTRLNKIWKASDITSTKKFRIVNGLVFQVVLYGCESWTIRKA